MTISLAWLRKFDGVEELVFASDSRLAFGCRWDCCPKLVALPRNDSAISFAGDTMYAYPVMLQAVAAIAQHPRLRSRGMELNDLRGHLQRVLNSMALLVHDLPNGMNNNPDTTFLFGGWSWRETRFKVWLLHFDAHLKRFTFRPSTPWGGGNNDKLFAFTGDYEAEFREKLIQLLRERGKIDEGGFDMEPLEVLINMLRSGTFDQIGGAPQIMKVYKYSSCMPYGVFWPNREAAAVSLLGRPLLDYEQSDYLVLDPDTLQTTKHIDVV